MRRQQEKNERLSLAELKAYRAEVRKMNDWQLQTEYQATHNAMRSVPHLPSPRLVQEFVQLWRELRRRRKLRF